MTKAEFFRLCDRAEKHVHQLSVKKVREYRGLDNVVVLTGSVWCRGGLTSMELYRPLPGRQGTGAAPYHVANARIDAIIPKFRRWLREWANLRGVRLMREAS